MSLANYFSIYHKLTEAEKQLLSRAAYEKKAEKGTILHTGMKDCIGLLVIKSGQIRGYITSDEGREITIYRLFDHDICLLSASCILNSIQFDITISVEKDAEFFVIPVGTFKKLMEQSLVVSNYMNQVMGTRLSEVMWLIEQVMWKSFDKRLAHFLIEESNLEETKVLKITHEKIAAHMGSAREVVTRMLKYFQTEGLVKLSRGTIEIIDYEELGHMQE